ncbi:MAG: hypothetical protein HYT49_01065 [Candidatus Wildermuthbacteria bacterium]|nr:hypothetical protein [Candidatus Wildermuthbacteria bacterium]
MTEKKKTLLIIDANSIIHRAWHALPSLTTPKGEDVHAVYGFFLVFFKVLKAFKPDYIAAAFDAPGPTKRQKTFSAYKAKRVKAPDELYSQIPLIKEALGELGIPVYEKQGFEADDYIGTVATLAARRQIHPPVETIIVSGDQDAFQLINEKTKVYTMRKGIQDTVLYDEKAVEKRFGGLKPAQIIDYKALRGDPSDNIPGVTGIGEKIAIELLNKFGSLENLYALLEAGEGEGKIKPRVAKLLTDYKEQAFLSQQLATIEKAAPIDFRLPDLAWREDAAKIQKVLERFGFHALAQRLGKENGFQASQAENSASSNARQHGQISFGEINRKTADPASQQGGLALPAGRQEIYEKIEQLYREEVFSKKIYELEKKLVPVLRKMEETGTKIDRPYFQALSHEMGKALDVLREKIHTYAGKEFNVSSTQQLSAVLFQDFALPVKGLKKTPKGVVSTASPELEKLAGAHPMVPEVLKYREIQKLLTTYAEPLPRLADENGRVHTHFDQLGAATGRISSAEPNLQNIPKQGEWGKRIRRGFIAEEGFSLVSFDYSQMELRIAAHLSGDEQMRSFFRAKADIHAMTASSVFGVPEGEVTPEMRFRAKALNFGVLYGMGAQGFAKSAGIPFEEARDFIDQYFVRFPRVYEYMEETKEFARSHGYVETMFGRRRYLPEVNSSTPQLRAAAERMAQNHPIQGSLADIVKMAMVRIQEDLALPEQEARMLLQIHDELLFEIADGIVEKTSRSVKELLENIWRFEVPLRVDVNMGRNWGELETLAL